MKKRGKEVGFGMNKLEVSDHRVPCTAESVVSSFKILITLAHGQGQPLEEITCLLSKRLWSVSISFVILALGLQYGPYWMVCFDDWAMSALVLGTRGVHSL